MKLNEKIRIFSAIKAVMVTVVLTCVASCSSFNKDESVATNYIKLINPSRDTIFSIANQKQHDAATITLEGILSDTSVISFSTDTLLQKTTFFVPDAGKPFSQVLNLESIKSDSLFIMYHPTKGSILGDVKIAVSFLKLN
jgi:hypothetical protein